MAEEKLTLAERKAFYEMHHAFEPEEANKTEIKKTYNELIAAKYNLPEEKAGEPVQVSEKVKTFYTRLVQLKGTIRALAGMR